MNDNFYLANIRQPQISLKRRLVGISGLALVILILIFRFVFPDAIFFARTGVFWASFLVFVICFSRIIFTLVDVCYARLPWTRIIIPAVIFLELGLLLFGKASREITAGVIAVVEILLILAGIFVAMRQRHDRKAEEPREIAIMKVLFLFLPIALAKWTAYEIVIIGSAVYAILHRFSIPDKTGYGYVKNSNFRFLSITLLISLIPELLLFQSLIRINFTILGVLLFLAHLWTILWTLGIYVTMKRRPHQITSTEIQINRGILSHTRFPTTAVETVRPLVANFIPCRTLNKDVAFFTVKGSPIVEITLNRPVAVFSLFGKSEHQAKRLFVSANNPGEFCQAILSEIDLCS
ncbi:hypothetical protein [Nostoc sp. PCC 9305]|uniref:hypothetical protein n=1 Tax=Nostoc sp. PCC 9305 TaxID=296636 RepID=UPI0039C6A820